MLVRELKTSISGMRLSSRSRPPITKMFDPTAEDEWRNLKIELFIYLREQRKEKSNRRRGMRARVLNEPEMVAVVKFDEMIGTNSSILNNSIN